MNIQTESLKVCLVGQSSYEDIHEYEKSPGGFFAWHEAIPTTVGRRPDVVSLTHVPTGKLVVLTRSEIIAEDVAIALEAVIGINWAGSDPFTDASAEAREQVKKILNGIWRL